MKNSGISIVFFLMSFVQISLGQSTLKSLLELAEFNYPGIEAKQSRADALKERVRLEKNTGIPSLDAAYQLNYATYNNITGMSYPGYLIPISGPPSTGNFYDPVPGTAAALIFKWSPLTFGQRSASVDYFQKMYERQLSEINDEVLKVKYRVAFLYFDIIALNELSGVYKKNIDRGESNLKQISTLVISGIRPSVDSLQFMGEVSKARTELFKIENLLETRKLELQELIATENNIGIRGNDSLFNNLPSLPLEKADAGNPLLVMAQLDVEANKYLLRQFNRSWTPRIDIWGTTNARGSGIRYDGTVNKADGWSFSRYNYGLGLQVVMPIIEISNVRVKSRQQEAMVRSSESSFEQISKSLNRQENIALNDLITTIKIAKEAPVEYEYNELAYRAMQARYNSGLIDFSELIKAQYDLLNAEVNLRIAYINSWKSLLMLSVVRGDMNIILNQMKE
jgi:outer membrane protein TolC